MKTLKLLFVICTVMVLAACQKDEDYINNDIREDFIGSWKCVQTSKLIPTSEFTVTIKKDSNLTGRIHLFNFTKLGVNSSVYATISTVNVSAVNIPIQTVQSNIIQGSGTQVNDTKINFEYTVDDGNETDTLTAVFTKL